MIVCLSCGTANNGGAGYCTQCNARLPKIDANQIQSGTGHITSRYEQIRDACDKVRNQAWSLEEFESYVANLFNFLESHKNAIIGYVKETGYFEYGQGEVEMGMTGVERYEEGLELIYSYVEDGVPETVLDQGLQLIWEGNEMINEAMRENRAARRKLEEEWGYM